MVRLFELAARMDKAGVAVARIGLIVVLLWIGGLKAFRYEADGIVPFVANSPFMSFFYADGGNYRLLDGEYPQAATNAVRVYVAGKPIRNAASAQYFVRWIDRLTEMAEAWPWWRTSAEKAHVMRQFGQARAVYANR